MKIAVIQASSQAGRNELMAYTVRKYAPCGSEVTRYNSVMMFNMRNDYEDRAYSDVCK